MYYALKILLKNTKTIIEIQFFLPNNLITFLALPSYAYFFSTIQNS